MVDYHKAQNIARIFTLSFAFLIAISALVPRAFGTVPVIITFVLIGMIFLYKKVLVYRNTKSFGMILVAFLCISGASSFWSVSYDHSIDRFFKLLALGLSSFVLFSSVKYLAEQEKARLCKKYLPFAYVIGLIILAIEIYTKQGIYQLFYNDEHLKDLKFSRLNVSASILTLAFWPIIYGLIRERKNLIACFIAIALPACVFFTRSESAQLAIIASFLGFCVVYTIRKYALMASYLVISAFIFFAPYIYSMMQSYWPEKLSAYVKRSALARLEVWEFFGQKIWEAPILGHGLGTVRTTIIPRGSFQYIEKGYVLHTHSSVLQIWYELGLLGISAFWILLTYIFIKIMRTKNRIDQAFFFALLTASLSISFVGYGVWQGWLIGAYIYTTAMMIYVIRSNANLSS